MSSTNKVQVELIGKDVEIQSTLDLSGLTIQTGSDFFVDVHVHVHVALHLVKKLGDTLQCIYSLGGLLSSLCNSEANIQSHLHSKS